MHTHQETNNKFSHRALSAADFNHISLYLIAVLSAQQISTTYTCAIAVASRHTDRLRQKNNSFSN